VEEVRQPRAQRAEHARDPEPRAHEESVLGVGSAVLLEEARLATAWGWAWGWAQGEGEGQVGLGLGQVGLGLGQVGLRFGLVRLGLG
jgi:hypothetical protein